MTFEYVLLGGVNDARRTPRKWWSCCAGCGRKVNLIALNPGPGIEFATPADGAGGGISEDSEGGWDSGVCAASARARHLRRLRATQANGRDCHSTGTVDSFSFDWRRRLDGGKFHAKQTSRRPRAVRAKSAAMFLQNALTCAQAEAVFGIDRRSRVDVRRTAASMAR